MGGNVIPVATLLLGAAVGALIVWLVLQTKTKRSFEEGKSESATQIAALDERVAAKDQELTRIQGASIRKLRNVIACERTTRS